MLLCVFDLISHAFARILDTVNPELVAHGQKREAHVHARGAFLRLGVVKKLGKIYMRRDRDHVVPKFDGFAAVVLGLFYVLFNVPAARGADVNQFFSHALAPFMVLLSSSLYKFR